MDDEYEELSFNLNSFSGINFITPIVGKLYKFIFQNGIKIHAKRKITQRNGVVNTNYLHIVIIYPSGKYEHYVENKEGKFIRKSTGKDTNFILGDLA